MNICSLCLNTPWHLLPSEEQKAYLHHSSLEGLENSALNCPLCDLILECLLDAITISIGEEPDNLGTLAQQLGRGLARNNPEDVPSTPLFKPGPGQRKYQTLKVWRDGTTHAIDLGDIDPEAFEDVDFTKSTFSPRDTPSNGEPGEEIPAPWIYANRWITQPAAIHNGQRAYSIIGFGVRATPYPERHQCTVYGTEITHFRGSSIRVFTDDHDPFAPAIPGRLREIESFSRRALNRVTEWLRTCDFRHECYTLERELPTRVLDLGTDLASPTIKLLESQGKRGKYITLSHSWGTSGSKFTTTASNLSDRKKAIRVEDMPLTFQDLIMVARHLYIRYVWIDSLCIIQRDEQDWEKEAQKMCEVYSHAYLTISASDATSSHDGLFPLRREMYMPVDIGSQGERNNQRTPSEFIQADISPGNRPACTLYFTKQWMRYSSLARPVIYRVGTFGRLLDPIMFEHLSSRAWTLQERLLAPRVLHYGRDQMYWECKNCFCAEDGTIFDPLTFSLDVVVAAQKLSPERHGIQRPFLVLMEGYTQKGEGGRWMGWLQLVSDFTQRNITYPDDRPPALSGIAKHLANQTNDKYLAGLWRNHIYEDLHWRAIVSDLAGPLVTIWKTQGMLQRKRMPHRAPSWSWASVESKVVFEPLEYDRLTAKLIGCHVTAAGSDPFGKISTGWIVVHVSEPKGHLPCDLVITHSKKAPLLEIRHQNPKNHPGDRFVTPELQTKASQGVPVEMDTIHGVSIGRVYFDFEAHFPCFALFLDPASALVLRNTGKAPLEFQRIGVAKFVQTESQRQSSGRRGYFATKASKPNSAGPITGNIERMYARIV